MELDLLCRYEISSNTAPSATPCATTLATVKMGRTVAAVAASAAAIAAYCAYSYYKKRRVIAAIRAMPKIELHVHLDGAFDADTLFKLSMARVDELPEAIASQIRACGTDINKFKALATCTGKEEQTLKAMIDKFVFFLPIVQGQYTYLEALAYRFVEGQALQNILYTEVRYSPHILTAAATFDGTSTDANDEEARAVVAAVTRGLRRGCAAHPGTEIAQILCFIDCQPQWADSLVAIATELKANDAFDSPTACDALPPCPVVAVDVAAGEAHFVDYFTSPSSDNGKLHRAAMCKCRANGLGLTNHAGESGPASHVALAASETYGGATRIGHGYEAVREAMRRRAMISAMIRRRWWRPSRGSACRMGCALSAARPPPGRRAVGLVRIGRTIQPQLSRGCRRTRRASKRGALLETACLLENGLLGPGGRYGQVATESDHLVRRPGRIQLEPNRRAGDCRLQDGPWHVKAQAADGQCGERRVFIGGVEGAADEAV